MAKSKIVYHVNKKGGLPKSLKDQMFTSYEQARSAVRKYIRTRKDYSYTGMNPAISEYNFSISRG